MNKPNDTTNNATEPVQDVDPFADVEAFRLSPETSTAAVQQVIVRVPVRKPGNQEFFRVHPDQQYRLDTGIIELRAERETYLVTPGLHAELADEMRVVRLYTCISSAGAVFLWPVPLPGPDGRRNGWHDSAHAAAELATEKWTRMRADMPAGQYATSVAKAEVPDPVWPEESFRDLLKLAFKEALIDKMDHPVVQRLRGLW